MTDDNRWECAFPGECLMPGEHMRGECHTKEMLDMQGEVDMTTPDNIEKLTIKRRRQLIKSYRNRPPSRSFFSFRLLHAEANEWALANIAIARAETGSHASDNAIAATLLDNEEVGP